MKVKVKLYGDFLRQGPEESIVELQDGSTVEELLKHFEISERNYIIILVNLKRSWFEGALKDGDTVSIFSPVGGG